VTKGEVGPEPGVHRFSHEAMATRFEIRCAHPDASYARQASQAAFELVDRLEQAMSRFIANSDVARINALAAGQGTPVSPATFECLEIARRMYDVTGGAFDVARGSGLESLEISPEGFMVCAHAPGVRLDLGGIGKGYAVDRAADLLEEWGIPQALVHGGFSSVLALEPPPGADGWSLTLSAPGPGEQRVLARMSARQKALSASGTRKEGHIVDPRTGVPVDNRAVWVAVGGRREADSGSPSALAECLSTAFMILSPDEIAALRVQWPEIEAWFHP
jgi:thiamine biosynthesis lipoprotein